MISLIYFFIASVGSAAFNYFFHILVARNLGPQSFSVFSAQWALFSVYLLPSAFVQYWSIFHANHFEKIKKVLIFSKILSILLVAFFFLLRNFQVLLLTVAIESCVFSILVGKYIGLGGFKKVNILNISSSLIKLLLLFVLTQIIANLDSVFIFLVIFLALNLVELFFYFYNRQSQNPLVSHEELVKKGWLGIFVLSTATILLPQIDILWVKLFSGADELIQISQLSLISKAAFFVQLILAQWFLPIQNKSNSSFLWLKPLRIMFLVLTIMIGSFAIATVAPYFLSLFLSWNSANSFLGFFLISLLAGFMSLFYQLVQLASLKEQNWLGLFALVILSAQWTISGLLGAGIYTYLEVSILVYLLIVIIISRKLNSLFIPRI